MDKNIIAGNVYTNPKLLENSLEEESDEDSEE